jgi:hypothetical protein
MKFKFSLNFPTFRVTKILVTLLLIQRSHFWTKCDLLKRVILTQTFLLYERDVITISPKHVILETYSEKISY